MHKLIPAITLLLLGFTLSAHAVTYKWYGDDGNVVYSQQPPEDERPYQRIKGLKKSLSEEATDNASEVDSADTTGGETSAGGGASEAEPSEEDIARQAKLRQQNCEAAKKNLDVYTVYRRFKNEDGTITTMSEEERQKHIQQAREDIETFCQ
ncbi:MAG: DUF4124 domain-containing protein [Thioalkalispiraceae bacterium]|jgi:hypothetical protein